MNEPKRWANILVIVVPVFMILFELIAALDVINDLSVKPNSLSTEIRYKYYKDTLNRSVNDISALTEDFQHVELNKARVEFGEHSYWYQIDIRNVRNSQRHFALLFDNPMLDQVRVYRGDSNWRLVSEFGDRSVNLSTTDIALPSYDFMLAPQQELSLLIRSTTLGAPHLPLAIFEYDDFVKYKDALYLTWGAFIGIVLLMIIYNLILYSGIREITYLLYVGYVGAFLIVLGFVHGYGVYILPKPLFVLLSKNLISLYYLLGICLLLFSYYFLRFNEQPNAVLSRLSKSFALVLLVLGVISIGLPEYQAAKPFLVLQLVVYLLCLAMLLSRARENLKWAKFYAISWLPLFIGSTVGTLMIIDGVEYGFWARHATLFGVMFEMAFISMALAERLNRSEEERLFHASHDHFFGFSNSNLLEGRIEQLARRKRASNFSVVVVEVERYENLMTYVSSENLKEVVYRFLADVELHLTQYLLVQDLDPVADFKKSAMIREGVFGYIVSSNDTVLLSKALQELSVKQPLNYQLNDLSLNFNCLSGAAAYNDFKDNPNELIVRAQQAIDIAQEHKAGYWIYSLAAKSEEGRKVQLSMELQKAIDNNELELYLQPQVDISTGYPVGAEALLRWSHPVFGKVPAREVITVAEKTGLINKLSTWVFINACSHQKLLHRKGFKGFSISVNFSSYDLILESFVSSILSILDDSSLKAEFFRLEFTEDNSLSSSRKFLQNLQELREIGFGITLDDFGTKDTSLIYVSRLPFTELKIDKSIIKNISTSTSSQSMVKATIKMAESLGLRIIAEGVENSENYRILNELGCHLAQGFLLSEAMSVMELIDWMEFEQIEEHLDTGISGG